MHKIKRKQRPAVVLVVAHPDDIANSMGGTAYLLKDRYRLHVLCLTRGERGLSPEPRQTTAALRSKEEAAVCRILGASLTFLGQIDGEACAESALCARVARILKRLKPAALFTLWPINFHHYHIAAYAVAIQSLYRSGLIHKIEVYMPENDPGGQTNQFTPDLYVNIDAVIEKKREMIRCHRSQHPDESRVERVIQRNAYRGALARCRYAEGFKVMQPLVNSRWGRRTCRMLLSL